MTLGQFKARLNGAKKGHSLLSKKRDALKARFGQLVREIVDAKREMAASILVERFDIEPSSDFSAKCANFIGLVLFCIDAKFCKKIFVGKLLTRSTRFTCFCTAQASICLQMFVDFWSFSKLEIQSGKENEKKRKKGEEK